MISTFSTFSSPAAREICNHLWQSTLFAVFVAILALALRKYPARARYWLWMAASAKFLVPFSLLIAAGSHLAPPVHPKLAQTSAYIAIDQMSRPFSSTSELQAALVSPQPVQTQHAVTPATVLVAVWPCGLLIALTGWLIQWRRIARTIRNATPLGEGRVVETLRRIERLARVERPIAVFSLPGPMEPGIFGVLRPVLLWPEAISEHLDDAQLEAVLAHEATHVLRRDNLTSLLHMLVEAIFWFHPLVWWMESQLVKERERACDEEVLRLCGKPQAYAESIVKVCELCLASPITCVSGITGADLKRRVGQIMTASIARKLGLRARLLLFGTALVSLTVPIMLGQMGGARVVAAVKTTASEGARGVSFAARMVSPIEPESTAGPSTLIAPAAPRDFQPSEAIELAQVEVPQDPSSPRSRLQQITLTAAADGTTRNSAPFPGTTVSPTPVYPPEVKAAGIQGVVELNATVTSAGTVANVVDVSGPQALRQSAIDAVMQWQFKPLGSGKSIAGVTNIRVLYQLPYQLPGMPPVMGPVPPAEEAAAGVKQYGGNVTAPLPIYETDPEYTDLARTDKVQGEVTVGLVVDERGQPQHVHVVRGLGDGLDEKAADAVKQYKFKPAKENDKAVAVFIYLNVNFKLKDLAGSAQMQADSQREYGSLKDGRFHNFLTDIELTVPDGYMFNGCGPSSSNGEQAYLRSPSKPDLAVWMRPVVEPIDGLRAGLRQKMINKPSERGDGWKERPESAQERTFSGKPGISVVADYMRNGKAWVEYLIWINTGKTHTQFYGQAEAGQLAVLQKNVDAFASSAVIP